MAHSFASFKRKLHEGGKLLVQNHGMGSGIESRIILKVQTNGIYTGRLLSLYPESIQKRYLTTGRDSLVFVGQGRTPFVKVFMDFPPASQVIIRGNNGECASFLSYTDTLSDGTHVVAPYSNIPVGQPWLELQVV